MSRQPVSDLRQAMKSDVCRIHQHATLTEAARLMAEREVGYLPVVENGDRLVGVITDFDLVCRGLADEHDTLTRPVSDVMSVDIVCCFEDQSVEDVRQLMAEHGFRRLPVMTRDYHLVGVVTLSDLDGRPHRTPTRITFHKEKTDSYGRPHKVAVKTVYITGTESPERAEVAAIKKVEKDLGGQPWSNLADSYDIKAGGTDKK